MPNTVPTLRTTLWLACGLYIVAASAIAALYQRLELPWWAFVGTLGLAGGLVTLGLEATLAAPVDALVRGQAPRHAPSEVRSLWRQSRRRKKRLDAVKADQAAAEARLETATRLMALLGAPEAEGASGLLEAARGPLGLAELHLLAGARVLAAAPAAPGAPAALAGLESESGAFMCLLAPTPAAPAWQGATWWVQPLGAGSRLVARLAAPERAWLPEEAAFWDALGVLLPVRLERPDAEPVGWRYDQARRRYTRLRTEPSA